MVKVNKEAYIPLLPYDLGYEETILQLIKSLDCLDKVVECVFEHVQGNISSQKSEIAKLNDRLNNVTNKVHRLSNIKKSVQIYSSSKYPAKHCQKDYEYSYDFDIKTNIIENIQVTHQIYVNRDPENKNKFYDVVDKNNKLINNKNIKIKGLGDIPDNVKYVNSLLLFNSNENLYKNYILSNPYKENNITRSEEVDNIENFYKPVLTLPISDTENQLNFFYTPVCEEGPSIDVPSDLPDLPGIAGDVQYTKQDTPTISKTTSIVDLPNFDELDDINNDKIVADDSITIVQEDVKPINEQLTTNNEDILVTQNTIDHIEENYSIKNDQNVNKTINDNVNAHSVLMDEIRNAGALKKAKLRSVDNEKMDTNETLSTGEGLMADLHRKLAMRRQGISGNNNQNDSSLGGVIYRMASTMLPPNLESESEADGDEDTEGDWDD